MSESGKRILYLYTEVMGYTMATVREIARLGNEVHLVHWDKKKLTPFKIQDTDRLFQYARSQTSDKSLLELCNNIDPQLVYVSGWQDRGYLKAARQLRRKGVPVVAGLDNQWHGTIRQRVAEVFGWYLKRFFSHVWVPGPYQFEYVRRLGFAKDEIIYDLYSADLNLFNGIYEKRKHRIGREYPHRFLFVGRLEHVKAVDILVGAWQDVGEQKKDWDLTIIGSGSMEKELKGLKGVTHIDFQQPEHLTKYLEMAGCFVLPSRKEPWGVVIHEHAAAGLPLICSDVCGAAATFLVPGLNGYSFPTGDQSALVDQMLKIINTSDDALCTMAQASHEMGQRISPTTSACNFLSLV